MIDVVVAQNGLRAIKCHPINKAELVISYMPVTISYDVATNDNNLRNYIRSMLERFHWKRLGGSVFRYEGVEREGILYEDWLNDVVPSLMFLRSFVLSRGITLKFFTLDASSVSFLDFSEPALPLGIAPQIGDDLAFAEPTNNQSSVATLRAFVTAAKEATA